MVVDHLILLQVNDWGFKQIWCANGLFICILVGNDFFYFQNPLHGVLALASENFNPFHWIFGIFFKDQKVILSYFKQLLVFAIVLTILLGSYDRFW